MSNEPVMSDESSGGKYQPARDLVGKTIEYKDNEMDEGVEGEIVDFTPTKLVNKETGEEREGAVRFILELDDGSHFETLGMAPDE